MLAKGSYNVPIANESEVIKMTTDTNKEMAELNELLEKMDSTTLMLVKANAELITQNKELQKKNDELMQAAG